ncbi:unnamed protein product [Merluccius merluccius]
MRCLILKPRGVRVSAGTWDASSSACDTDGLCDPAVLVASAASQPHIRNRRLSPGSGSCGGGGGGCIAGGDQPPRPETPEGGALYTPALRREKERRGLQKGRGQRREGRGERGPQRPPKERWVEESLALLRPPRSFPVQDSPAKLLPAVSYASKVKAGPALEEEPPAIGVLLQNQWGLSFISEARPAPETPGPTDAAPPPPLEEDGGGEMTPSSPVSSPISSPAPAVRLARPGPEEQNDAKLLMLSYPHLEAALEYHTREWRSICIRQKESKRVVWYKDTLQHPA